MSDSRDYIQKKKDRLARLRTLTMFPHGIDYDRIRNYFSRVTGRPKDNQYKIRHEVHSPKRHHLVEEMALTSQFLARARKTLHDWEADLLDRYDSTPDEELLAWVKRERNEDWDKAKLRRQILRIKRKLGAGNERLESRNKPAKVEKPRLLDVLEEAVESVKQTIFGVKK